MRNLIGTLTFLFAVCLSPESTAADKPAQVERDQAFAKLGQFVGGAWTNGDPKFKVEFQYQWAFNKTAVRSSGIIDKGGKNETKVEATLGWDPVKKTVYYLDFHGGERIYYGTVDLKGDEIHFDFKTLVGPPAQWRSNGKFTDADTYEFTILGEKDGKWAPVVKQTLKRKTAAASPANGDRLIVEGVVEAPVAHVWSAMTTKEGMESWMVAHAEIDLKVGGKMLTHYDPKGEIGDPNTIENTIISYEPSRMFSIKATKPPEKFPFKEGLKNMWTVVYFDDIGANRTRVRIVGMGYTNDDEGKKLRAFFEKGNEYTVKKLQEKFAGK